MVLPVEVKPPTMYSTQPNVRTEIEQLVREHHQNNLLGKDGRIYEKAVVIHSGDPEEHCTVEYHAGDFVKTQHIYRKD
ncbi:hypothetical protein BDV11DRAFT_174008 [Aspergillus similis]